MRGPPKQLVWRVSGEAQKELGDWPCQASASLPPLILPPLIVVSHSASTLARLALHRGEHPLHVMDACGDSDSRLDCASHTRLALDEAGCFRPAPLLRAVRRLASQPGMRLCYGSGFEARPALLKALSRCLPLLGNDADTVARCQNPRLANASLRRLAIPHPDTQPARGFCSRGRWLVKRTGGSGGTHVRHLRSPGPDAGSAFGRTQRQPLDPACDYLQRHASGPLLSALFVANGETARILGFNRQFSGDRQGGEFVFSGAITYTPPDALRATVQKWLQKLVPHLGLRGLCGIDLVAPTHARPLFLELNPRPPASWPLHVLDALSAEAFTWHEQGCQGQLPATPAQGRRKTVAMRHLFAWQAMRPGPVSAWPDWVDNPPAPRHYQPGEPLCTVLAQGDDEGQALSRLRYRHRQIRRILQQSLRPPAQGEVAGLV